MGNSTRRPAYYLKPTFCISISDMRGFKKLSILFFIAAVLAAGALWLQRQGMAVPAGFPVEKTMIGLFLTFAVSFISWISATFNHSLQNNYGIGSYLRRWLSVAHDKRVPESDWVTWSIHLALWTALPILILREWGLTETSQDLFRRVAMAGIPVGESHIVPGKILLGVVLFAALVTITRWIKHRLHVHWLSRTPMHPGTREAVATMFGYITFILAAIAALSIAGFDLTNLAIMAGALGVGIGFGLQNIVNNFISGIILLFERPIRPGDFITVGNTEGFVRNVSIRSTELETLDRMSVIVPNSDMLTNHLQNWTLRDPFGRITVSVGVAYGSDTEKVKQILLDVASNNKDVIQAGHAFVPAPSVQFRGFGDSSLDFELKVFIRQIERRWVINSDLNFAIDAAFREHDVTIPFPQRDVWFRNVMHTRGEEPS